jgi:transcriptional regulator with XRE-family HTH domain
MACLSPTRVCLPKNLFSEILKKSDPPPAQPNIDAIDADIGARIKAAREERGFTQNAVANRTKMADHAARGISRTSVIGYEQGTSNPGLREIRLLCEVLRVTPNWLVYGTDAAGPVTQSSMEVFSLAPNGELKNVMKAALALIALKGHERDSILSLVLSLAGRQLGDARLAGLLAAGNLMSDVFSKELKNWVPTIEATTSLEEIAQEISVQQGTNFGTKLRFEDEDDPTKVTGGEWIYPDPKNHEESKKS